MWFGKFINEKVWSEDLDVRVWSEALVAEGCGLEG